MILRLLLIVICSSILFSQENNLLPRTNPDSIASLLYAEGNYWKLMEISKQYNTDTLSAKYLFSLGMSYAALSEPQRAQELLRRSIALDSTRLQYRFQYARLLHQAGLFQEAVNQLSVCILMDSMYIPAQFQLGLTYAAQKKFPEKEIEIFSSLLRRNPNDFLSLYYIADALKRSNQTDSAALFLRQALSINPRYNPALIALSNYLSGKKQYAEALPYYLTSDSVRGDNKDLKFQIGECYRKLNDLSSAKIYFKRAISLDTTNALYYAQLAYAYFSAEQFDSSAMYYQYAIVNDDENPQYYLNLALVYKKLELTELVIQSYKNAIRVMHSDVIANVYNDLAEFCYQKKLNREAIDAYQRSVDIKPDNVDALYYIASVHMRLFENQLALQSYTKYLQRSEHDSTRSGIRYSAQKMVDYLKTVKKNR